MKSTGTSSRLNFYYLKKKTTLFCIHGGDGGYAGERERLRKNRYGMV
jgi:hypothetical protein